MTGSGSNMKVRVDMRKNRLYFTISGKITKADMEGFYTDVRFGVADLQPGFDVITDLSNCQIGHLAAIPTFRKVMHYIASKGVREVVRVVNPRNVIYRQIMNLAARFQGYIPVYVETVPAAEELLDSPRARKGLRFNLLNSEIYFGAEELSSIGKLKDMSISGCSLTSTAERPAVGEKIQVKILLYDQKGASKVFELASEVVRMFDGGFAVTFGEMEESVKNELKDCLVQEAKRDL